jgi:hypothetical protein
MRNPLVIRTINIPQSSMIQILRVINSISHDYTQLTRSNMVLRPD